ncbi:MAG: hypothetical protein BWK73_52000 [Thiothrix lacustris]|uniref:Uncharacterized protein n=1 Tax=Thiothrix lacustris TaxID=525917 RepID=A0A1Y1Q7P4_9GAMM|nr:MAG: hypothetical protein BWK73_52000 [Thiothrix lacustris]
MIELQMRNGERYMQIHFVLMAKIYFLLMMSVWLLHKETNKRFSKFTLNIQMLFHLKEPPTKDGY